MKNTATTATVEQEKLVQYRMFALLALAAAIYMVLASALFAGGNSVTPMGTVLCNIVTMFSGNLGRGLSTLAVLVVGVGATLGKVSWGLAITVAVGIAVIMNATTVAGAVGNFSGC